MAQAERLVADVVMVHSPAVPEIGTMATAQGCDAVMVTRERPAISESIRAGFVALEAMHDLSKVTGALLILGDQPLLSIQVIRAVVAAGKAKTALVRPRYAESPEPPGLASHHVRRVERQVQRWNRPFWGRPRTRWWAGPMGKPTAVIS